MDYEKKYKGVLEAARQGKSIEEIFQELRESENEKWAKWLIGHLKGYMNQTDEKYAEVCKEAIDWLEKQKPLKTTDIENELNHWMVCEAFHEGVDTLPKAMKIVEITAHHFYELGIKEQKSVGKIEPITDGLKTEFQKIVSYLIASVYEHEWPYTRGFVEYAAQQLLGYANNELKQKEWSEEDDKWAEEIRLALRFYSKDKPFVDKLTAWFNNHIQPKPKQKWSEEDDKMRKRAICACNFTIDRLGGSAHYEEARDWLKSLPIGFITNPNYNEDMVTLLISELRQIAKENNSPKQYDGEIDWLKSLRSNHWKPSKEQMEALERTVSISNFGIEKERLNALEQLLDELKILRNYE